MIDNYNRSLKSINLLELVNLKYKNEVIENRTNIFYQIKQKYNYNEDFIGFYHIHDEMKLSIPTFENNNSGSDYISCLKYIDNIVKNSKRYKISVEYNTFIDFIYNILNDTDYRQKIMGILLLNYDESQEYLNVTHPLILLDFIFKVNNNLNSFSINDRLELIIFEYPDEYKQLDKDMGNIIDYIENMKKLILELSKNKLTDLDSQHLKQLRLKEQILYLNNKISMFFDSSTIKNMYNNFIIPVDRMSSYFVVPFYGWNYVKSIDNAYIGNNIFNYINLTGNINIENFSNSGKYCTGSLPANIDGLKSLKGNNLSSSYTKKCINIEKNYTWIQANLIVSKYIIDIYKGKNNKKDSND